MPTFNGTGGPDTINGTDDADDIFGLGGDDFLNGLGGGDFIDGGEGNDTIDGGAGADFMAGGAGNDTYHVDDAGDAVSDFLAGGNDGGFDIVYTTISWRLGHLTGEYIERLSARDLRGTNFLQLTGNALSNEIWGNDGVSWLDGGAGADILHGEKGDDIYFVDNAGDVAVEAVGEGYDTIFVQNGTLTGYGLPSNTERLIATDSANVTNLAGNDLANEIIGNSQNNSLVGALFNFSADVDILRGGDGDDTYTLRSGINGGLPAALDLVIEQADEGYDRVVTNFSYALPDHVEALQGIGTLIGNQLDNEIVGIINADVLDGRGGADVLRGGAGNDVYFIDDIGDVIQEGGGADVVFIADFDYVLPAALERGGAVDRSSAQAFNLTGNDAANEMWGNDGANWLDARLGRDILTGGGGADTFAFTTLVDGHNADLFLGFEVGIDKVALDDAVFVGLTAGTLPAEAFKQGRFATDADDRILYEASTGTLFFDPDGTGPAAAQYFASMSDRLALTANDFVVI